MDGPARAVPVQLWRAVECEAAGAWCHLGRRNVALPVLGRTSVLGRWDFRYDPASLARIGRKDLRGPGYRQSSGSRGAGLRNVGFAPKRSIVKGVVRCLI